MIDQLKAILTVTISIFILFIISKLFTNISNTNLTAAIGAFIFFISWLPIRKIIDLLFK